MANATKTAKRGGSLRRRVTALLIIAYLPIASFGAHAAEVSVAIASNFLDTGTELAHRFEQQSGHRILISSGSTGALFAQISQGAPFRIFLAADLARPRRLVERELAEEESLLVYALGRLALWSPDAGSPEAARAMLESEQFAHLALANPKTAPYGAAAAEVITAIAPKAGERAVYGGNIAQAFQYVAAGHAELGFVALSQLSSADPAGAFWPVPASLHAPIRQAAVLLKAAGEGDGESGAAARQFLAYLASTEARTVIAAHGYGLPAE